MYPIDTNGIAEELNKENSKVKNKVLESILEHIKRGYEWVDPEVMSTGFYDSNENEIQQILKTEKLENPFNDKKIKNPKRKALEIIYIEMVERVVDILSLRCSHDS